MKQTNERLCALAQKGDATALDSLIDNNKSFIGKVANDLFRSMNLAQAGLNLDTDDLKQAGNLGLWKAVPKFDAARGMKFLTYAAPAIRNAMMDMVRDAFAAFEQRMVTEDKDGVCYQRVSLDDVLPGEEQLRLTPDFRTGKVGSAGFSGSDSAVSISGRPAYCTRMRSSRFAVCSTDAIPTAAPSRMQSAALRAAHL